MKSPLSNLPPEKTKYLSKEYIINELYKYYGDNPPENILQGDYEMYRCSETGFEFCHPPIPGSELFYNWIGNQSSYYPKVRWEYKKVAELIQPLNFTSKQISIIDVGCGDGNFLDSIESIPISGRYCIDFSEVAISSCKRKGYNAYHGSLSQALSQRFISTNTFQIVTSFHCLEHVPDPVGFVKELVSVITSDGRIYISTPYSPMSFESEWFDIMNHPPHHMGRWNLKSYKKLAEVLGMKMRYYFPRSYPLKQALSLYKILCYGPHVTISLSTLIRDLVRSFPDFIQIYRRLLIRSSNHELRGADIILVELSF